MNTRIELTDNTVDAVMKLSEGNLGAVSVCTMALKETPEIDPQAAFGGLGTLLFLDALGIYGPRIWMLYKDVCGESLPRTLALLRANQLGFISRPDLNAAIDDYGRNIDLDDLCNQVTERLEEFNIEYAS